MVTNKYVYNLSKTSLKRKIEITKIDAITVSTSSTEFVLHSNYLLKIKDELYKLNFNYYILWDNLDDYSNQKNIKIYLF